MQCIIWSIALFIWSLNAFGCPTLHFRLRAWLHAPCHPEDRKMVLELLQYWWHHACVQVCRCTWSRWPFHRRRAGIWLHWQPCSQALSQKLRVGHPKALKLQMNGAMDYTYIASNLTLFMPAQIRFWQPKGWVYGWLAKGLHAMPDLRMLHSQV